jgi:haloacetate dehalogenase
LCAADALGLQEFFLAGHDRGGRVAHRLALDHPGRVRKLCVLDIAPTLDMHEATGPDFAQVRQRQGALCAVGSQIVSLQF